jgi:hypothetical protein
MGDAFAESPEAPSDVESGEGIISRIHRPTRVPDGCLSPFGTKMGKGFFAGVDGPFPPEVDFLGISGWEE